MPPPLNAEFCFYKYRSPKMGKTLQAIYRMFRASVTALGFVEDAPRRIRIQLRDPDYHIAVQAHDQRLPIVRVGELLREGRSFVLNQPRQLRIGQQEEA